MAKNPRVISVDIKDENGVSRKVWIDVATWKYYTELRKGLLTSKERQAKFIEFLNNLEDEQ